MIEPFLAFLAEVALKSTLLIALAAVAAWVARCGPAALRHRIWCSALASVAALPLVMLVIPRLEVPVLPALPERALPLPSDLSDQSDTVEVVPPQAAAPVEERKGFPWANVLMALYAAGAATSALGLALSLQRLRRVTRHAERAPDRETRALELVAGLLGIEPPALRIAGNGGPAVPMTWGARRPVLLLPNSVATWPEAYLRSALAHEAAHIRRGDWAVQLAVRALCVFYWFHPLARWAAARLRIEAERACDDLALLSGIHAADYAACLLEVTRMYREDRPDRQLALTALPMAQSTALAERLRAVLDSEAERRERRRGIGVVISVAALAAVLITGAIHATPTRPAAARSSDMAMALAMIQGRGTVQYVPKSKTSLQSQVAALRARLKAAESEVRRLRALGSKPAGAGSSRLNAGKGTGDPDITGGITTEEWRQENLAQAEASRALAAADLAQAKAQERAVEAEREKAEALVEAQRARAAADNTRAEGSLAEQIRQVQANARAQEAELLAEANRARAADNERATSSLALKVRQVEANARAKEAEIIRRKTAKDQEDFKRADRDARIDELVRRGYLAERDAKRKADEYARKSERIKALEGASRSRSGVGAVGGSLGSDGRGLPGLGGDLSGPGGDGVNTGSSDVTPGLRGSGSGSPSDAGGSRSGGSPMGGAGLPGAGRGGIRGGAPIGGAGLFGGADSAGRASNGVVPRGSGLPGMGGSMAPRMGGSAYGNGGGRSAQNATVRSYDDEADDLQDQIRHIELDIQFAQRKLERVRQRVQAGQASLEQSDDAELKLQHLTLDRDAVMRRLKRLDENRSRRMRGTGMGTPRR